MIKTPKETFAEAVAKYRELEASLRMAIAQAQNDITLLSSQRDTLTNEVRGLVSERDIKSAELAENVRLLNQKKKEHLVWVSEQLIVGKAELDKAIAEYGVKLVELDVDKNAVRQEAQKYSDLQSALLIEREQFKTEKEKFNAEREVIRQNALDDRSLMREITDKQRTLTGILEEREKATRPIPQPTKIKGRR